MMELGTILKRKRGEDSEQERVPSQKFIELASQAQSNSFPICSVCQKTPEDGAFQITTCDCLDRVCKLCYLELRDSIPSRVDYDDEGETLTVSLDPIPCPTCRHPMSPSLVVDRTLKNIIQNQPVLTCAEKTVFLRKDTQAHVETCLSCCRSKMVYLQSCQDEVSRDERLLVEKKKAYKKSKLSLKEDMSYILSKQIALSRVETSLSERETAVLEKENALRVREDCIGKREALYEMREDILEAREDAFEEKNELFEKEKDAFEEEQKDVFEKGVPL
jgi:hypothetical protein